MSSVALSWRAWSRQPVAKVIDAIAAPMSNAEFWKVRANTHMVTAQSSILAAAQKMVSMKMSYLVVVDDNEGTVPMDESRVLGLATERNLLKWSLEHPGHSESWRSGTPIGVVDAITTPTSSITCARPDSSVGDCLRLMKTGIFRHLPVIDFDCEDSVPRCKGILKIRDLLMPLRTSGDPLPNTIKYSPLKRLFPASAENISPEDIRSVSADAVWGEQTTAGDVLGIKRSLAGVTDAASLKTYMLERQRQITLRSDASVEMAMHQLAANKLTFIVVVDENWQVQGLVTERHCTQAIGEAPFIDLAKTSVLNIMTPLPELHCVRTVDSASRCLSLMMAYNIRHLPVLTGPSGDHLGGILSLRDMVQPLVPDEAGDAPSVGTKGPKSSKPGM